MSEQTVAEKIKFNLEFMCFMLQCGRDEEADKAYNKAMELTQELIDREQ